VSLPASCWSRTAPLIYFLYPPRFFQNRVLCVGDREARTDGQCGELVDRIAANAPVRKLVVVESLGHRRVPFAGYRLEHRTGVELAAIDASFSGSGGRPRTSMR
jgi:hypothetical protein